MNPFQPIQVFHSKVIALKTRPCASAVDKMKITTIFLMVKIWRHFCTECSSDEDWRKALKMGTTLIYPVFIISILVVSVLQVKATIYVDWAPFSHMFLLQKRGVQLPFLHQMVDTSVCVILNDVAVVRLSMKRKKKSEALRGRTFADCVY